MLTEEQIKTKWKTQHDILSEAYYNGTSGLTKEEFDIQHGAIWEMLDSELITEEYRSIPEPPRDLEAEMDKLKARVGSLEISK